MRRKKKFIGYVMSGVFTAGIIGGMGASTLAFTSEDNVEVKKTENVLSTKATQDRFQKIIEELNALGITPPSEKMDREVYLASLDDATKEKIKAIKESLKVNKLTPDEARELRKQRINLPNQDKNAGKFANIDEDTNTKAKEIIQKLLARIITKEEAIASLKALGIPLTELEAMNKSLETVVSRTKSEIDAINKKLEEGTITKEEAALEIRKLRVKSQK